MYFVSTYKDGFETIRFTSINPSPTLDLIKISPLYFPVFKPDLFMVTVGNDFFFVEPFTLSK